MNAMSEDLTLRFVAEKLAGYRVLSVGATPTDAGQDIIVRLQTDQWTDKLARDQDTELWMNWWVKRQIGEMLSQVQEMNTIEVFETAPETAQNAQQGYGERW